MGCKRSSDRASKGSDPGDVSFGSIDSDGGAGLIAAVESVWPHVSRQRCWAHKLRNVANKVKKRNEKACLDGARLIYLARNRTEAAKRFRAWRDRWIEIEPKAVLCLEADI